MPRWLVPPLLLLASCDDTVFVAAPVAYTPDWDGVTVFLDDHCAACHAPGAGNPVVLPDDLLADAQAGTGDLVVAGDPAASVFWRVIANELQEGDFASMPIGAPLPAGTIAPIKTWIEDGAVVPASEDSP